MRNLPPSTLFSGTAEPAPEAKPARSATELARDPFELTPHGQAMLDANVTLAPLTMVWDYRVTDAAAFSSWLATKDMLLKPARLANDPRLAGMRYAGSYRVASDTDEKPRFRTVWGFTDQSAIDSMQALCGGNYETATITQIDLIEFVEGIKRAISAAGDEHFSQDVLVASPALSNTG